MILFLTSVVMQLPPVEVIKSRALLAQLTQQQSGDSSLWEVGANCNFLIAAARLGLRPACIGNLGEDVYGRFLLEALEVTSKTLASGFDGCSAISP